MLLTRWCSEDADRCPREGKPTNETRDELLHAGWTVKAKRDNEGPAVEKPKFGWTFETLGDSTLIEFWTCPACTKRLEREAGVHYTFKRHAGRKNVRKPITLTIPNRQADIMIARHGAKGDDDGFVDFKRTNRKTKADQVTGSHSGR